MDRIEFQLRVIGPSAQGDQAQNFVHDLRDLAKTRVWSHQLKNEPGLASIYERKWRPFASSNTHGFGYDVITHAGGALGNVSVYVNAGAEVRAGWNLPGDFGTSYIRPGGNSNTPTTVNDPRVGNTRPCGLYVFAAVTGRLGGRDIFLDGNTFTDSHDVDKKAAVGDFIVGEGGVVVVFRRYKLSYTQVFRSREFDGQRDKPNFGSISLSMTF